MPKGLELKSGLGISSAHQPFCKPLGDNHLKQLSADEQRLWEELVYKKQHNKDDTYWHDILVSHASSAFNEDIETLEIITQNEWVAAEFTGKKNRISCYVNKHKMLMIN